MLSAASSLTDGTQLGTLLDVGSQNIGDIGGAITSGDLTGAVELVTDATTEGATAIGKDELAAGLANAGSYATSATEAIQGGDLVTGIADGMVALDTVHEAQG